MRGKLRAHHGQQWARTSQDTKNDDDDEQLRVHYAEWGSTASSKARASQKESLVGEGNGKPNDGEIILRSRRFSGGHPVSTSAHPTVVQVLYYDQRACDGSIISEFFVLTGAHCVMEFWYEKIRVLIHSKFEAFLHSVTNVEYHENYFPKNGTNDIAILKLKEPILEKNGVLYVKLLRNGEMVSHGRLVVSYKWSDDRDDDKSTILTASEDQLLTKDECEKFYGREFVLPTGLLCARTRQEDKIANEMSGGPVMLGAYQVGIKIADRYVDKQPVIYTNVTSYIDWIDATKLQLLKSDQPGTTFHNLPKKELSYNAKYRGELASDELSTSTVSIVNAKSGKLMCVGNVVSKDMVLTTARCARKGYANMRARVFSSTYSKGYKEYQFTKTYTHEKFDADVYPHVHDVALLTVSPDFAYSKVVRKIKMVPLGKEIKIYQPEWVYGFGGGSLLRRVQSCVIPEDECKWLYRKSGELRDGMICAKSFYGWCNHVAGEPLIIEGGLLAGILTATSQDCADHRDPAVFINVTANLNWIKKKLTHLNVKGEEL